MAIGLPTSLVRLLLAGVLLLMLAGCASMAPAERPVADSTEVWNVALPDTETSLPPDPQWWQRFGSPELDRLIARAFEQSPDLAATAERVIQAEQQVRIAGSTLFPSLNVSGSSGARATREDSSSRRSESTSLALGASYEIDLWGNLAAGRDGAEASLLANRYDFDAARLSLASAVATSWFRLLTLEERLRVAQENLRIAERTEQIVDARFRNGAASRDELLRQQTTVLNQRASLAPLQLQFRQTRAALAVLTGASPLGFEVQTESEALLTVNIPGIEAGLPSDLLIRRPDLARQEARLQAADANVEQARTAFLPSLSLTGNVGAGTTSLFSLANPAETAGWTIALAQTLFDGGRREAQQTISQSQRLELVEQYRAAILVALQETDDALDRVQVSAGQEALQQTINGQAARTLELTELRYREGNEQLLTLLDAQRTLFQTRDQLVQLRLDRLLAAVDLYKALGGGWQSEEQAPN